MTNSEKIKAIILNLITKYIVWIVIVVVIAAWFYFPNLTETMAKILLFWSPAIIIIFSLIIALTRNSFKAKKDEERGIFQYDLILTKIEFYLVDLTIYGGALLILVAGHIFNEKGIGVIDLLQALIFFIMATAIKQIFYKKIIK
jgi:hypothetical protein